LELLERRVLFHLELVSPLSDTAVAPGTGESTIELSNHFDNEEITGTIVRLDTNLGAVDVELLDKGPVQTVQNFLGYVERGAYDNTLFHRAVPNFLVQGGGFNVSAVNEPVPTHIPVVARSRTRTASPAATSAGRSR
jgi:hypothetical protein